MAKSLSLKECMTPTQRTSLGNLPTYHKHCMDKCGVARPGKTRRDRLKRLGLGKIVMHQQSR